MRRAVVEMAADSLRAVAIDLVHAGQPELAQHCLQLASMLEGVYWAYVERKEEVGE